MKRTIFILVATVLSFAFLVYLYLLLAVNAKIKETKELMKLQPDSIVINDTVYYFHKD
jgi:hypothetical protein